MENSEDDSLLDASGSNSDVEMERISPVATTPLKTPLKNVKVVLERVTDVYSSPKQIPQKAPSSSPASCVGHVTGSPRRIRQRTGVTSRMAQFKLLDTIFGNSPTHQLPATLFLWGASASGKCYTLERVLETKENIHVIKMHCAEILCGKRAFFETFVKQLVSYRDHILETNFKCDSLNSLYGNIFDFMHPETEDETSTVRVVTIVQGADKLRGEHDDILQFFSCLRNIVNSNICVVFLSSLPPTHFMPNIMEHVFIPIHFPQYISEELIEILKETKVPRRSSKSGSYFEFYVKMIVNIFYVVCRDIRKLKRLAKCHWNSFQEMVDESEDVNLTRLWKKFEPQLKSKFNELNSASTSASHGFDVCNGNNDSQKNQESNNAYSNLPLNAKYLAIAAYLATHNPPSSDKRFFVKSGGGKVKKSRKTVATKTDTNSSKAFVRSFELNRLTAIFNFIQEYSDDKAVNKNRSVGFMTLLSTMCQNRVIQHLGEDSVGNVKYKSLLDYDSVLDISKSVNFELNRYLYRLV